MRVKLELRENHHGKIDSTNIRRGNHMVALMQRTGRGSDLPYLKKTRWWALT
jgi:hypothetical protein